MTPRVAPVWVVYEAYQPHQCHLQEVVICVSSPVMEVEAEYQVGKAEVQEALAPRASRDSADHHSSPVSTNLCGLVAANIRSRDVKVIWKADHLRCRDLHGGHGQSPGRALHGVLVLKGDWAEDDLASPWVDQSSDHRDLCRSFDTNHGEHLGDRSLYRHGICPFCHHDNHRSGPDQSYDNRHDKIDCYQHVATDHHTGVLLRDRMSRNPARRRVCEEFGRTDDNLGPRNLRVVGEMFSALVAQGVRSGV